MRLTNPGSRLGVSFTVDIQEEEAGGVGDPDALFQ